MKWSAAHKHEDGYTLIEVVLYLLISSVVMWQAFSLFNMVSKKYKNESDLSTMQGDGRNALVMMAREIKNTGFKFFLRESPATVFTCQRIAMLTTQENGDAAADATASFTFIPGDRSDILEIYKATLDDQGQNPIQEKIRYSLKADTLQRIYETFAGGAWQGTTTTELMTNVNALQFQFSTDRNTWVDNPAGNRHNMKAIKIIILLQCKNPSSMKFTHNFNVGDKVFTYSNDSYQRRILEEIVEVINNGQV